MAVDMVATVRAEQFAAPTPCVEWDVRALINHMASGNLRVAAMISGDPGPDPDSDVLGDHPLEAFRDSVQRICAAFDGEGMVEQTFTTAFGEGSGRLLIALRISELTLHMWDLAAATGQPRGLDPEVVAFADAAFRTRPIPRGDESPIGPEKPVPPSATPADRLAAFAGRNVPNTWPL